MCASEPHTAREKFRAGFSAYMNNEDEAAERLYLDGLERVSGVGDESALADGLHLVAQLYWAKGRLDDAEPYFLRALETHESIEPKDDMSIGTILGQVGELYRLQGKYKQAEEFFLRSAQTLESVLGQHNKLLADLCLDNYLQTLNAMGRVPEAEAVRSRIEQIREGNIEGRE